MFLRLQIFVPYLPPLPYLHCDLGEKATCSGDPILIMLLNNGQAGLVLGWNILHQVRPVLVKPGLKLVD